MDSEKPPVRRRRRNAEPLFPKDAEAAEKQRKHEEFMLRRGAAIKAGLARNPREAKLPSVLRALRIDKIEELMAALQWSSRIRKQLAITWGVTDNPYMHEIAAIASRRLLKEVSKRHDVKRDLCVALQLGLKDCTSKGRWQELKGLADTYAHLVGLDEKFEQAKHGTQVQIVMPGGEGGAQMGTTPAMRMLFKPREVVETTFEPTEPPRYIEDPVERAIAEDSDEEDDTDE